MRRLHSTALIFLSLSACEESGTEGAALASDCVEAELLAQCPAGTLPRLEAEAETRCDQAGSLSLNGGLASQDGEGEISQVCVGMGRCRAVCELQSPCRYGIERLSREEIICAAEPVGDFCERGSARCDGAQIQSCDLQGRWEAPRDCPVETRCSELGGEASCIMNGAGGAGGAGGTGGAG
ncbi:MAG: hypothetical protein VYD19_03205, partial [Myxococcota bacterium]|nr:hypothetical protein [Myxococcota bacterium]